MSLRNVLVASTWSRGIRCDMPCAGLHPVLYCTVWVGGLAYGCARESHQSEPLENWRVTGESPESHSIRMRCAVCMLLRRYVPHVIMCVLPS